MRAPGGVARAGFSCARGDFCGCFSQPFGRYFARDGRPSPMSSRPSPSAGTDRWTGPVAAAVVPPDTGADAWPDFTPPLRRDYPAVSVVGFCTAALRFCWILSAKASPVRFIRRPSRGAKHPSYPFESLYFLSRRIALPRFPSPLLAREKPAPIAGDGFGSAAELRAVRLHRYQSVGSRPLIPVKLAP